MCLATRTMNKATTIGKEFTPSSSLSVSSFPTSDHKVVRQSFVADGSRIRSRFFDRLGIRTSSRVVSSNPTPSSCYCSLPATASPTTRTSIPSSSPPSSLSSTTPALALPRNHQRRQLKLSPAQRELLKKDHGKPDESLGPASYSKTSFSPSKSHLMRNRNHKEGTHTTKKVVSFANAVEVVPIPSHRDYSNRIRNSFWTNRMEMRQNYARNVLEFTAENWDYKQVLEEDQFLPVLAQQQLVLIHPVHYYVQQQQQQQQRCNLKWRSFCAIMAAQQKQQQQQHQQQHL